MTQASQPSTAFLTFTLHAHLPYVVNHGTWPHGIEWLHEAAAETYLPLLRVLRNLERDHIRFQCNLNLSPILLEQLAHPVFIAEFSKYLARKIVAAQEDEAFFLQSGETHYADLARFWRGFFQQALGDFNALGGSIVSGFRHFNETGLISVMTCSATHGYLPLLGTDESVRAQVRLAVATHQRHFGSAPRGIWSPECGYRPAGEWSCPVPDADGTAPPPAFSRIGVEQAFSESGLDFFFVDTHLIEGPRRFSGVYELRDDHASFSSQSPSNGSSSSDDRSLYQPYLVDGPYLSERPAEAPVAVFPRDPRTGLQVWSGDTGYPGDASYLDFHKKRWPGGHRYWRVSGAHVDMNDKEPYLPADALARVQAHADHFTHLVHQTLSSAIPSGSRPILCAPFDAELFGHWWFEGPHWLEAVARNLHDLRATLGIDLISASDYLDQFPATRLLSLPEGSWGSAGNNQVWLNGETGWTWTHIYPAERYVRELVTGADWHASATGIAIAQQLCRELLLLESSDWQFLITTGAARDYAEARFLTHVDQFNELRAFWQSFATTGALTPEQQARLTEINTRDGIFPDLDPSLWAKGARATPPPHLASIAPVV